MKNRDLNWNRYPTTEELYALERAARVARATEVAHLVAAAVARIKHFLRPTTKGLRHA
jgi:hypothetical protein